MATHLKPSMKLLRYLLFFVALANGQFKAQQPAHPSKLKTQGIVVNLANETVQATMLTKPSTLKADNNKTYTWYNNQSLLETKGGYSGKLLHGPYTACFLNKQLKEQGLFKHGLRHKQWKYWYPDGKLKEVITWKHGEKNGYYALYNDFGQLMARGNFKKDKLHGKFFTYGTNGAITEKKRYNNGNEVLKSETITENPDNEKPGFLKKLKHKKQKPEKDTEPKSKVKPEISS